MKRCEFATCAAGSGSARPVAHRQVPAFLRDPAVWVWVVVALLALLPIATGGN